MLFFEISSFCHVLTLDWLDSVAITCVYLFIYFMLPNWLAVTPDCDKLTRGMRGWSFYTQGYRTCTKIDLKSSFEEDISIYLLRIDFIRLKLKVLNFYRALKNISVIGFWVTKKTTTKLCYKMFCFPRRCYYNGVTLLCFHCSSNFSSGQRPTHSNFIWLEQYCLY